MYFGNYRLQNAWLDKLLKSLASEDPSISNMVNGLKRCRNLKPSTFTIITDHCLGN